MIPFPGPLVVIQANRADKVKKCGRNQYFIKNCNFKIINTNKENKYNKLAAVWKLIGNGNWTDII